MWGKKGEEREKGGKEKRRDGSMEGGDERKEVGREGERERRRWEEESIYECFFLLLLFVQVTRWTWKSMSCVCS